MSIIQEVTSNTKYSREEKAKSEYTIELHRQGWLVQQGNKQDVKRRQRDARGS